MTDRQFALFCAVINHGLGNLAKDAVPAKPETITSTADKFGEWLEKNK